MPLILRLLAPVLVNATFSGWLVWFTALIPKSSLAGTSFTLPEVTVIVAIADAVELSTEVASKVTFGLAGTAAGAV